MFAFYKLQINMTFSLQEYIYFLNFCLKKLNQIVGALKLIMILANLMANLRLIYGNFITK